MFRGVLARQRGATRESYMLEKISSLRRVINFAQDVRTITDGEWRGSAVAKPARLETTSRWHEFQRRYTAELKHRADLPDELLRLSSGGR